MSRSYRANQLSWAVKQKIIKAHGYDYNDGLKITSTEAFNYYESFPLPVEYNHNIIKFNDAIHSHVDTMQSSNKHHNEFYDMITDVYSDYYDYELVELNENQWHHIKGFNDNMKSLDYYNDGNISKVYAYYYSHNPELNEILIGSDTSIDDYEQLIHNNITDDDIMLTVNHLIVTYEIGSYYGWFSGGSHVRKPVDYINAYRYYGVRTRGIDYIESLYGNDVNKWPDVNSIIDDINARISEDDFKFNLHYVDSVCVKMFDYGDYKRYHYEPADDNAYYHEIPRNDKALLKMLSDDYEMSYHKHHCDYCQRKRVLTNKSIKNVDMSLHDVIKAYNTDGMISDDYDADDMIDY